jgi:hypothetical protein
MFFAFWKSKEWYYIHYVGLRGNIVEIAKEEPMSVFLPTGYVLFFVDKREQVGYIYLTSSKYGEAEYVFGLCTNDRQTEQRGRFTIWRSLPFVRRRADAIYGDDTEVPYFSWIETGWLHFAFGNIDRVSVARLQEMKSSSFSTNQVEWIKVGNSTY